MNAPQLTISYLQHRRAIGWLGLALPPILVLGGLAAGVAVQPSLSDYHHGAMRDGFVGMLAMIAMALYAYRGHGRLDDLSADAACVLAVATAMVPTDPPGERSVAGIVHLIAAGLFLLVLAWICLGLFTRRAADGAATAAKLARDRVYRTCGWTIIVALALCCLHVALVQGRWRALDDLRPVLLLETAAVWAFSLSWLVKGQAVLRDAPG